MRPRDGGKTTQTRTASRTDATEMTERRISPASDHAHVLSVKSAKSSRSRPAGRTSTEGMWPRSAERCIQSTRETSGPTRPWSKQPSKAGEGQRRREIAGEGGRSHLVEVVVDVVAVDAQEDGGEQQHDQHDVHVVVVVVEVRAHLQSRGHQGVIN